MAVAAQTIESKPTVRRFQLADLNKHGGWIARRLVKVYPNHTENSLVGFLRGVMDSPEFLFLYQTHGVALATAQRPDPLAAKAIVKEIFVFAEEGYIDDALSFYDEFARWAKSKDIDVLLVEEMSDVPHDKIKERLGRIFTRQQQFARL